MWMKINTMKKRFFTNEKRWKIEEKFFSFWCNKEWNFVKQTHAQRKGKINKKNLRQKMKLWKSKKSSTTSCVSAVSGKLNLSGNKNGYKDEDQSETISPTPTSQSTIHLANGLHQGEKMWHIERRSIVEKIPPSYWSPQAVTFSRKFVFRLKTFRTSRDFLSDTRLDSLFSSSENENLNSPKWNPTHGELLYESSQSAHYSNFLLEKL